MNAVESLPMEMKHEGPGGMVVLPRQLRDQLRESTAFHSWILHGRSGDELLV